MGWHTSFPQEIFPFLIDIEIDMFALGCCFLSFMFFRPVLYTTEMFTAQSFPVISMEERQKMDMF